MPVVSTGGSQGRYRVTVYKRWDTNPDREWSNTHEFAGSASLPDDDAENIAAAYSFFERSLHSVRVNIVRTVVSTWAPFDTKPYNANEFASFPYTDVKGVRAVGDPLDLRNVALIQRKVGSGRYGKLMIRGAMGESDVSANSSGSWDVTSPAYGIAVTAAHSELVLALANYSAVPVMYSVNEQGVAVEREILSHVFDRVSVLQLKRGPRKPQQN